MSNFQKKQGYSIIVKNEHYFFVLYANVDLFGNFMYNFHSSIFEFSDVEPFLSGSKSVIRERLKDFHMIAIKKNIYSSNSEFYRLYFNYFKSYAKIFLKTKGYSDSHIYNILRLIHYFPIDLRKDFVLFLTRQGVI